MYSTNLVAGSKLCMLSRESWKYFFDDIVGDDEVVLCEFFGRAKSEHLKRDVIDF